VARTQAANYGQRQEAIIEKAAELFSRKGFNGTSVAELAAACNTSKSLVYHYYPSKEEILYAVMSSHVDQLVADVEDVLDGLGEARARLDRLIHAFMAHYVGAAARQKVLLNELDNLPEKPRAIIVGKQRRIIAAVQALLVALHPALARDAARARHDNAAVRHDQLDAHLV